MFRKLLSCRAQMHYAFGTAPICCKSSQVAEQQAHCARESRLRLMLCCVWVSVGAA
jgi:hypothetical protein